MQAQTQMMIQNGQAVGFNANMYSNGNDINGIGSALTGGFGLKDSITTGMTAGAGAYDAGNHHQQVGNYSDTVTGGLNPNNFDINTPLNQRLKQAAAERGQLNIGGQAPQMMNNGMGQPQMMNNGMGQPQMMNNGMGQPQMMNNGMGQPQMMNNGMSQPQMMNNGMSQPQMMNNGGHRQENFAQPQMMNNPMMNQMGQSSLPPPLQQIQQTHLGQVFQNQIQQQVQQQLQQQAHQQLQQQQRAYQEQINQLQAQLQQMQQTPYNVKPVLKHPNQQHSNHEDPETVNMKNELRNAAKEIIEKTEKNEKQFQLLKAYENYLWKEYRKLNDQIVYYGSVVKQVNNNYGVVMNGLKQFGHLIERQDKIVTINGTNGHIVYTFDSPVNNISQIKIIHTVVKNERYNITTNNNRLIYDIHTDEGIMRKQLEIEPENYTIDELIETINPALDEIQIEHNGITNKVSIVSNQQVSLVFAENTTWNILGFNSDQTEAHTKITASVGCKLEHQPIYKLFFSDIFTNHVLEFNHGQTLHNQIIELEQPLAKLTKLNLLIVDDSDNTLTYPIELKIQFIQSKGYDYMESMREFSMVKEIKEILPINEFEKKAVLESNFSSQPVIAMPESITGKRVKFDESVVDNAKPPSPPEIIQPEYYEESQQPQQMMPTSRNYYGLDLSHIDPVVIQHGISLGYITE
jgi:type II secretory pathway pseudopilin PulG